MREQVEMAVAVLAALVAALAQAEHQGRQTQVVAAAARDKVLQ
jgi:hypothetical protein